MVAALQHCSTLFHASRRLSTTTLPRSWRWPSRVKKTHDVEMGVSLNGGTPKSSILIGFSMINHLFLGTPIFRNIQIFVQKTHRRNTAIFDVLRCWLQDYAVITRKEKPFDPGSTILHLQRQSLVCLKKDTASTVFAFVCWLRVANSIFEGVFYCQPLSPIYLDMVLSPWNEGQWLSELLPWSPGELNAREVIEEAPGPVATLVAQNV